MLRAALAAGLIAWTLVLLPGQVKRPPASPEETGGVGKSTDTISVAALYSSPYGGDQSHSRLSWSWAIADGKSTPTFFASVHSPTAHGSLVLGGPLSHLVSECHLNGNLVDPSPGSPANLGFEVPPEAHFWFDGRQESMVTHIDFQGDTSPDGTFIWCSVHGFETDDPPVHRLYTPGLLAYAQGSELATAADLRLHDVCVDVSSKSSAQQEKCADNFNTVSILDDGEQLITVPAEQGMHDASLILVGAVAGAAASAVLEFLTRLLSALGGKLRST